MARRHAVVYIAKPEFDFWTANNPDFSNCKGDQAFIDQVVAIAGANLEAAKDRIRFFNDGEVLFDNNKLQIIPGHTPGHTLCHITSAGKALTHMGDITHDAALLLINPEWGVMFDTDFNAAGIARRLMLDAFASSESMLFSCHLSWPALGHIKAKNKAFEWLPAAYFMPQNQ